MREQELNKPILSFLHGLTERDSFEMEAKGYCNDAIVELPAGSRFRVCFYDPVRLAQDLECEQRDGEVCIAEPGLIVIPSVTVPNMQRAVQKLHRIGYFDSLIPMT